MSTEASLPAKRRNATIVVALAVLNFVILLFPPLTWYLGQNGIWFFLIGGVIGVVSLLIMYRVDSSAGED
ncbi:hypothetical protein ACTJJE_24930 [Mycolicibacterium sp. 22603]|uniref:hypothetical protein n=1 Tax=Mycolicibacterium sp. 22603 TaxID=3453950 RepID=UPI003F85A5C8